MSCNIKVPYLSALVHKFGPSSTKQHESSAVLEVQIAKSSVVVPTSTIVHVYRTSLPVPMLSHSDVSFWNILKQCVGKELSKITMPVAFNEPLSFIQRLAEYMEYATLVDMASKCDNPIERMELVAAFSVSALSCNFGRTGKPFNPLLGETYELNRPDLGFRYVGEQVSHHPPITAFNAEGDGYTFQGSIQPKLKFWGKSVEIVPKGTIMLTLHRYREIYTWQNVNCLVHNIMVGALWVECVGLMEITCNKSNISASLNFKQGGWFERDLHCVEGYVYQGKRKERAVYGSWIVGLHSSSAEAFDAYIKTSAAKSITAVKGTNPSNIKPTSFCYQVPGQKTIWKVNPRPQNSDMYYKFTLFSMTLNELFPDMKGVLPPTDTRFRPDIRNMEEGKLDKSAEEKNRVEEKQRETRKEMKEEKKERQPRWFHLQKIPATGREDWVFNPDYWKRNYEGITNIF